MRLEKRFAACATCCNKDAARFATDCVQVTEKLATNGWLAESTDGRHALQVFRGWNGADSGPRTLVKAKDWTGTLKKRKKCDDRDFPLAGMADHGLPVAEGRFPDIDSVTPNGEPLASVRLDAKLLANLANAIAKTGLDGEGITSVTIEIRGDCKPVILRNGDATDGAIGLLMPLTRNR